MAPFVSSTPGVVLSKVDIDSLSEGQQRQVTLEFRFNSIPYLRIYGKDGSLLGIVEGANLAQTESLVKKGL